MESRCRMSRGRCFRRSPTARLLIAGQAPGTRVHASGRPFTDPSGERLRQWLGIGPEIFYDPTKVAVVPMGFCFPGQDERGGDLPPRRECAPAWRSRLDGGTAAHRTGDRRRRSMPRNGIWARWRRVTLPTRCATGARASTLHPAVIPMPHPSWRNNAWLKANPWFDR